MGALAERAYSAARDFSYGRSGTTINYEGGIPEQGENFQGKNVTSHGEGTLRSGAKLAITSVLAKEQGGESFVHMQVVEPDGHVSRQARIGDFREPGSHDMWYDSGEDPAYERGRYDHRFDNVGQDLEDPAYLAQKAQALEFWSGIFAQAGFELAP